MQVLADRVLLLPDATEWQTASGIVFADTVTSTASDYLRATVVGIGHGHVTDAGTLLPLKVKVGQRVLYNRHAGHELNVLDVEHVIVRESDIVGVLD